MTAIQIAYFCPDCDVCVTLHTDAVQAHGCAGCAERPSLDCHDCEPCVPGEWMANEGDVVECPGCGLTGTVAVDGEDAVIVWGEEVSR